MKSRRQIYRQSEFKSFDKFIDCAAELMITRADIEDLLLKPESVLSSFLVQLDKKMVVTAFYGLGERSFNKIKSLLNKSELKLLIKYCKDLKEPSTASQWAAQKEILVRFERFTLNRADNKT